jgi:L-amino acid N-acyltransferase
VTGHCSQTTTVRAARPDDLGQILAIYNEVIRNSTAVYSEVEFTTARGEQWFAAKADQGFPFLVAEEGAEIVGFGTFGEFRAWPCYRHTVEHSLHVRADRRGRGVGKALLAALIERATLMHKHVMIAGIDADNAASIGLHRRSGFAEAGRFHEVGFKFGRWLDLVFLELRLSEAAPPSPSSG